jgi:TolB-like protein/tetratricopeptide (TPR) repeat protein
MLAPGSRVGPYEVISPLGAGGMGEVYRARDTALGREVALKTVPDEVARSPERLARLRREARVLASLNHPGIATVHGLETSDDGRPVLAMELVEGETLSQRLRHGPVPLGRALRLGEEIATALAAAHERRVLHRDLKPSNIGFTSGGRPKLLDFGLARGLTGEETAWDSRLSTETSPLSGPDHVVGTPGYMSPEQIRGEPLDERSDVWAFGCVLYELLTGRRAFPGATFAEVAAAILEREPDWSALPGGAPAEVERLLRRCVRKEKDDRLRAVADARLELGELRRTEVSSGALEGGPVETAPVSRAGGRRRLVVRSLAAVLVVAAAVLVSRQLTRRSPLEEDVPTASPRAADTEAPGRVQSLAVLPFDNLMNDPEQDYLVDGVQDALITNLSKIGVLRVISRTSTMRYAHSTTSTPEIARELNVDALVEGSVLRVGDRVRIAAQLVHGPRDETLWAESYDRDLRDVLVVLGEVAQTIAGEIRVELTPDETARLAVAAVDPEAQEAYLRARHYLGQLPRPEAERSLAYFQKAVEIQPDFAAAHAMVGSGHLALALLGVEPPAEALPRARAAAERALALDENESDAHTVLGFVRLYADWDWKGAEAAFRRALELNPSDPRAHHGLGDCLTAVGRVDEGTAMVLRGRSYDPISPARNWTAFIHLILSRRYDEVITETRALLADQPHPTFRSFLSTALWLRGEHEQAVAEYRAAMRSQPEIVEALDRGLAAGGPRGAWRAVANLGTLDPIGLALLYSRAGEVDAALEWLERAHEVRALGVILIAAQPDFDALRSDPRFDDLARRIGLQVRPSDDR